MYEYFCVDAFEPHCCMKAKMYTIERRKFDCLIVPGFSVSLIHNEQLSTPFFTGHLSYILTNTWRCRPTRCGGD